MWLLNLVWAELMLPEDIQDFVLILEIKGDFNLKSDENNNMII